MAVVVTVNDFRQAFPEFSDTTSYPDALLQRFLTWAQAYISTQSFYIKDNIRLLLIQLMAAHLITLSEIDPQTHTVVSMGGVAGAEVSASVGGVSVSKQGQISKDSLEQWLQSTGYGQQYLAILQAHNLGMYFVGNPRAWGIK